MRAALALTVLLASCTTYVQAPRADFSRITKTLSRPLGVTVQVRNVPGERIGKHVGGLASVEQYGYEVKRLHKTLRSRIEEAAIRAGFEAAATGALLTLDAQFQSLDVLTRDPWFTPGDGADAKVAGVMSLSDASGPIFTDDITGVVSEASSNEPVVLFEVLDRAITAWFSRLEQRLAADPALAQRFGGAAAKGGSGLQTFVGERRRARQEGLKSAALPLKTINISAAMKSVVDEMLLTELLRASFDAIGRDDLNALLDFEKQRDAVDCSDAACIAEIGNALGVPYLVSGNVAKVEDNTVVTLKMMDVRATRVVARVSRMAPGGEEILPRLLAESVQEMLAQSGL